MDCPLFFRAVLRPNISGDVGWELHSLVKKVEESTANEEERVRYHELRKELQERYKEKSKGSGLNNQQSVAKL